MGLTSITEKASLKFSWYDKADCKFRIARGNLFITIMYLFAANALFGQVNSFDSLGRKQGLWITYPDSIFNPLSGKYVEKKELFIALIRQCQNDQTLNYEKSIKITEMYLEGQKHGPIKAELDTFIIYTGQFKYDKAQDIFYVYGYDNGILDCKPRLNFMCSYLDGKLHGPKVQFGLYHDENIKSIVPFIHKIVFYRNGKLSHKVYLNFWGRKSKNWIKKRTYRKYYLTPSKNQISEKVIHR